MILQKLIVKDVEEYELYYQKRNNIKVSNGNLFFVKGTKFSTNTYFNSFSIEKWKKFCAIEEISLHICYSGKFQLKVYESCIVDNKLQENIIYDLILSSKEIETTSICTFSDKIDGVVYYELESLEEESILYSAFYSGKAKEEKEITLALNICTYNREEYLLKNLSLLRREFLENQDSCLLGCLKIFITDNASTWDTKKYSNKDIFIFHNPNEGGAGGFTRGLIEIEKRKEELGITHVIFMDDDVEIEPEALIRTYRLLKVLKKEYEQSFIAGAMLRMDKKYIQHENGALWKAGNCNFINRGIDLRRFENIVFNELEQKRDYAAWWYCCIPISVVNNNNLPIPIFIHQDDTEYSLRNTRSIISMNGIAIWHTADDHVRLSTNEYYNLRNLLIVNAKYCPEFNKYMAGRKVLSKMLVALLRYRYKDIHLIYRAVEDFCKGPEWLIKVDSAGLHNELRNLGYQFIDLSGLKYKEQKNMTNCPFKIRNEVWTMRGFFRCLLIVLTANGWILPAKEHEYHYMDVHPVNLYRTGSITLHDGKGKGIQVKRDFKQIFTFLRLYLKVWKLLLFDYDKVKKKYYNEWNKLITLSERNYKNTQ